MTQTEQAQARTALFLSSMAVTARALDCPDPVAITLVPCNPSLGYVQYIGRDDRVSTSDMRSRIVVNLAGVVAEDLLGDRTTGCSRVLMNAHQLATRIAELELADRPDNFVTGTIDSGMERARALVAEHRGAIDTLAALLVQKGEINGDELKDFMANHVPVAAESVADIPRYCS